MTKAFDKLKPALEEAVRVARCDHEMVLENSNAFRATYFCKTCGARIIKPHSHIEGK